MLFFGAFEMCCPFLSAVSVPISQMILGWLTLGAATPSQTSSCRFKALSPIWRKIIGASICQLRRCLSLDAFQTELPQLCSTGHTGKHACCWKSHSQVWEHQQALCTCEGHTPDQGVLHCKWPVCQTMFYFVSGQWAAKSHPDFIQKGSINDLQERAHFVGIKEELSQGIQLAQSMPCSTFQSGLSERDRLNSFILSSPQTSSTFCKLIVSHLAFWLCSHSEQKYPVRMLSFTSSSVLTISFQTRVSPMDWSKTIQAYKVKTRLHYPRRPFCSRDKLQGRL